MANLIVNPYSTMYPYSTMSYVNPTVINATALTPSTSFPVASVVPIVPTVTSLTNTIMAPLAPSVVSYQDVNADRNLRSEVTEYFFEKILKNWLKYHFLELYQMVVVSGGKANLIGDVTQIASNTKNDPTENAIKYEFIVDNFMTKNDVYKLLGQFRKINSLNWWDLKHYSDKVRHYIFHKVSKQMKKEVVRSK